MKTHPNFLLLALIAPVFAWSAWFPFDRLTWWLEVAPVLLGFCVVSVCLAISATYELIEWAAALLSAEAAASFLGTQGDAWDTQWDMFLAGMGALAAIFLLSRMHDKSMARL